MNILGKIAKACGIAGGLWGILMSLIWLFLWGARNPGTFSSEMDSTGRMITRNYSPGPLNLDVYLLIFTGLMGLVGLLAVLVTKKNPKIGLISIWISALAILIVSMFLLPLSIFFALSIILLVISAVGVQAKYKIGFFN